VLITPYYLKGTYELMASYSFCPCTYVMDKKQTHTIGFPVKGKVIGLKLSTALGFTYSEREVYLLS